MSIPSFSMLMPGLLQFCCSHLLLDIRRATVKDPEQRLLVEALDLGFDRLNIRHVVAVR